MAVLAADNSWALGIDHLYVDAAGVPVLVEVKRSTDTRLSREVVAQMLDYAASAAQELKGWSSIYLSELAQDDTAFHELLKAISILAGNHPT